MQLSPGDKLGPYEIHSPLGAGGMGEVYKALDTRLDRSVAIKVLPEHIAQREDLRLRFEREARAVASLNHPHICVLHDIGNQDGTGYMVMEYMEGETLAARIEKGAIPLDQALMFGTQIAGALDRAHRAGVTHRDVKPQNIMLTRDGVKVLDFGLAKSTSKSAPPEATLTKVLTSEGTVLGTPQYMAPEQFEGKEADARSDIWAFGAVLYEMVTGRKTFQGKSYTGLVGAILSADPAPMAVKPFTPSWLERLVRQCLAKDPDDRYQSMRDVVLDLRTPPQESAAGTAPIRRWPWIAAAGICLALGALAGAAWVRQASAPRLPVTFTVDLEEGNRFDFRGSAISPDGRMLAFTARNDRGESLLHVRSVDSLEARAFAGTHEANFPFWSPDSRSLAFVAGGKLKRMDVASGVPIALCDVADRFLGGTWNQQGVILFGEREAGLRRIPASGGTPAPVSQVDKNSGEKDHVFPKFLPSGNQFLYLARYGEREKTGIFVGSLDGKPPVRLVQTESSASYDTGSARLLFIQGNGTLMAQPLDLGTFKLSGEPVKVAESIRRFSPAGYAEFSVSDRGELLYQQRNAPKAVRFAWRNREGKLLGTTVPVDGSSSFRLSPDESRVAYSLRSGDGNREVWTLDLVRAVRTRISSDAHWPRWSPDGEHLYYTKSSGIHRRAADGSGEEQLLIPGFENVVHAVAPGAKLLLYGEAGILLKPLVGEGKPQPYLQGKYEVTGPVLSPDGRWLAYASRENGRNEIVVQGFPDRRGKWPVSNEEGNYPQWRADGKELYWIRRQDDMVMAASMALEGPGVRVGQAIPLFRLPSAETGPFLQPARDGQRFLVWESEGRQAQQPLVVELNWAARLGK